MLTIISTHFVDKTFDLNSAESSQPWVEGVDTHIENAWVDCGTTNTKFYLHDGNQTPLNPFIFADRRDGSPYQFSIL